MSAFAEGRFPKVTAEILAVGSEMLTPSRVDTNSLWLTAQLNALGVEVAAKHILGDDRARLTEAIRRAWRDSQLVILTGGLGPTEDDLTRECAAEALGIDLVFVDAILEGIAEKFRRFGRKMADNNRRQAYVLPGGEVLDNPRGTAPGQWLSRDAKVLMLLPGPPRELKPLFEEACLPRLRALLPPLAIATRWYRIAGMGESDCDSLIAPVYTQYTNPVTTILAKPGDIELHLRAQAATIEEADQLAGELGAKLEELLGDRIYSRDGAPLETAVGRILTARKETVAVAESMTGGLLGMRLTESPGSSAWFRGGWLVYHEELKRQLIGGDLPGRPVSEETAKALASAARDKAGADWGLAITGFAGPDGDEVGLTWVALAGSRGTEARRFQFLRERAVVRAYAATYALDWLRRALDPQPR